jgi:hypothetical protein
MHTMPKKNFRLRAYWPLNGGLVIVQILYLQGHAELVVSNHQSIVSQGR